jgi:hypothetical protein
VGPEHPYDQAELLKSLHSALAVLRFHDRDKGRLKRACRFYVDALDICRGRTLQERWIDFEQTVWPKWVATRIAIHSAKRTRAGALIAVLTRHVRPTAKWVASMRVLEWIKHLPDNDPLVEQRQILTKTLETVRWAASKWCKQVALTNGLRILLVRGYSSLREITEEDLGILPYPVGADLLDCALCELGVFGRMPRGKRCFLELGHS